MDGALLDSQERIVRVVEAKALDLSADGDGGGEREEVDGVPAGVVGDADDAALPVEGVVRERGDRRHVDGVDGERAAAVEMGEGLGDEFAGRGEGHGGVERDAGVVGRLARPHCAELDREALAVLLARECIDLAAPMAGDLDGEMGGGTEADETETAAALDAGDAQRAVADDARAEERGGVNGVEAGRQGNAKRSSATMRRA